MYAFMFYRFGYPANVVFTPGRACPSGGEAVHYCCQILYILIYQKLYIVIFQLHHRWKLALRYRNPKTLLPLFNFFQTQNLYGVLV